MKYIYIILLVTCHSLLFAQVKVTKGGNVLMGQYQNPENTVNVGVLAPLSGIPTVFPETGKFNVVSHFRTALVIDHHDTRLPSYGAICNSDQLLSKHWVSSYNGIHNFYVTAGGDVYSRKTYKLAGDSNFKFRTINITNPMNKIMQLRGVSFSYKQGFAGNYKSEDTLVRHFGFIAQEVEKVFPELVSTESDSSKWLDPMGLLPVLLEGVKQQQNEINQLRNEIYTLKNGNSSNNNSGIFNSKPKGTYIINDIVASKADTDKIISIKGKSNPGNWVIGIYQPDGKWLMNFSETIQNSKEIKIPGGSLQPGIYYCILMVEGVEMSTKKMILIN